MQGALAGSLPSGGLVSPARGTISSRIQSSLGWAMFESKCPAVSTVGPTYRPDPHRRRRHEYPIPAPSSRSAPAFLLRSSCTPVVKGPEPPRSICSELGDPENTSPSGSRGRAPGGTDASAGFPQQVGPPFDSALILHSTRLELVSFPLHEASMSSYYAPI